jgi:integrase
LYGAGLRLQESVNLDRTDVDWKEAVMTIRHTKFAKTRLVPIGPQLLGVLDGYARRSRSQGKDSPFFTTRTGTRLYKELLQDYFVILREHANVCRFDGARYQPRLHDLRHTFAVHRLTSWYQQGADVQKLLPHLSTYLGHVHIQATQVYLTMTPELLHSAGNRFAGYVGQEARHEE